MASSTNIVITGSGLVTCLGLDRETTWRAVRAGRCGVGPLTMVESPLDPNKGGGEVHDPDESGNPATPREVRLLRRAIREALQDAGLDINASRNQFPCPGERVAVLLGTTLHGMRNGGAFLRTGDSHQLERFLGGATMRGALGELSPVGFTTTNCSACSSGLASVSLGHSLLMTGEADLVIAGGYDPISEYAYAGFNAMRLVSPTSLRPFAKTRDGMKVAEGYAIVILERESDAGGRGASTRGVISGYGESCDAYHLSKPHPEGAGACSAMRTALAHAGLRPEDIDMLVAHATATPDNDASEFQALLQVFGAHLRSTPVVGLKSHLGHTLGAAGTVDLILAMLSIRDNVAPRVEGFDNDTLAFDELRYDPSMQADRSLQHTLNTSLGFGGANACMVVSAPGNLRSRTATERSARIEPTTTSHTDDDVVITGVGVVLPGAIGTQALCGLVSGDAPASMEAMRGPIAPSQFEHLLNARRTRRMSGYAKLCLAATADAYDHAGITDVAEFGERCAAIVGSAHGAAEYCHTYYRQLIDEGINAANPMLFAEGVPNVASAHITTTFSVKGFCQSLIGTRTCGLEALHLGVARIRAGVWSQAIVCAADDAFDVTSQAYRNALGDDCFVDGSGAVALILERRASAVGRGATIRARVTGSFGLGPCTRSTGETVARLAEATDRLGPLDGIALPGTAVPVDRLCALAARRSNRRRPSGTMLTSLYGRLPELFAAGPLVALAAMVCTRTIWAPTLIPGNQNPQERSFTPHPIRNGGVICGDFAGGYAGAAIELE